MLTSLNLAAATHWLRVYGQEKAPLAGIRASFRRGLATSLAAPLALAFTASVTSPGLAQEAISPAGQIEPQQDTAAQEKPRPGWRPRSEVLAARPAEKQWSTETTATNAPSTGLERGSDLFDNGIDRLYPRRRPRREQLRITSWDLRDAAAEGLLVRQQKSEPVWRHTFGAERRRTQRPKSVADRIGADIAILQGIHNIRETRALFPARGWNVVFSRSLVNRRSASRISSAGQRLSFAVAHRYIRGLRTTGYEPIRLIAEAAYDEAGKRRELPASNVGLGIRFSYYGYVFWTASATLPDGCTLDLDADPVKSTCREANRLRDWVIEKREDLQPVLTGGRLRGSQEPAVAARNRPQREVKAADRDAPGQRTQIATAPRSNWSDFWSAPPKKNGTAGGEKKTSTPQTSTVDCNSQVLNGPTGTHHNAQHVKGIGCLARLSLNPPQPSNAPKVPRPATSDTQ